MATRIDHQFLATNNALVQTTVSLIYVEGNMFFSLVKIYITVVIIVHETSGKLLTKT